MVEFLSALKSMLSGSDDVSTTRVITFLTVLTILGVFVFQNILSIFFKPHGFVDFPANAVYVLLITLGAKVGQHVSEMQAPVNKQITPEPPSIDPPNQQTPA